jgi:hypothetical protein
MMAHHHSITYGLNILGFSLYSEIVPNLDIKPGRGATGGQSDVDSYKR